MNYFGQNYFTAWHFAAALLIGSLLLPGPTPSGSGSVLISPTTQNRQKARQDEWRRRLEREDEEIMTLLAVIAICS